MPEYPTNPVYSARQYDDLARLIKEEARTLFLDDDLMRGSKRRVAERLADRFATDNPAFDREKFLRACGLEAE